VELLVNCKMNLAWPIRRDVLTVLVALCFNYTITCISRRYMNNLLCFCRVSYINFNMTQPVHCNLYTRKKNGMGDPRLYSAQT
jgi:hypothetical protein